MRRTSAARRMSETTSTCFWSQRSTYAPAIGENRRFGIVETRNVIATARGESVISNTKAMSASWLTRSPNRLMSWPTHRAENEPLRASRMYGCARIPSSRDGRRTSGMAGTAMPVAETAAAAGV